MAVNTTLTGLSQTASSNGPDGSTDAPSTLDDAQRYLGSFIAALRDGDGYGIFNSIASAATVNLGISNSYNTEITGTTAITAVTLTEGKQRLVRFAGTPLLTNGASLVLPGGQNIQTAAGDYALFVGRASGVVHVIDYQRAAISPATRYLAQVVSASTAAVATGTTLIPQDNTIPQITEGDLYLTRSITPTNASSTLEIEVMLWISNNQTGAFIGAALFRDSTANGLVGSGVLQQTANGMNQIKLYYSVAAGSTASTTFTVRAGGNVAGTTTLNGFAGVGLYGGVGASQIVIREYLP